MDAARRRDTSVTSALEVSAERETPVFLRAGESSLLGFLTRPDPDGTGPTLIALAGGARQTSMGRNRMLVRMSRRLAANGVNALRFDYHGVGESTGRIDALSLEAPFVQDLDAAATWLGSQGFDASLFAGVCFGARTALAGAAARPGTIGVAFVELPIGHTARRTGKRYSTRRMLGMALRPWVLLGLFRREDRAYYRKAVRAKLRSLRGRRHRPPAGRGHSWVDTTVLDAIGSLLQRGTRLLFIYGDSGENYRDFQAANSGPLGKLLRDAASQVEVRTTPGQLHGFSDLPSQERVIELIADWARDVVAPRGSDAAKGGDGHL